MNAAGEMGTLEDLKLAIYELASLREAIKTKDVTISSLEAQIATLQAGRASDRTTIKALEAAVAEFTKVRQ